MRQRIRPARRPRLRPLLTTRSNATSTRGNDFAEALEALQPPRRRSSYLSTGELARLNHACLLVHEAFGGHTYLVGSSSERSDFRDVDVRTILADEEFDALFADRPFVWSLLCLSVSNYLSALSSLPVDFQVQRMTEANERYIAGSRNPIGTRSRLFAGGGDATNLN